MDFNGLDGFLGTRASFMLDVVFIAMFIVVPVMGWSIYLIKYKRNFWLHKRIQVGLGLTLLVAVTVFEVDIRLHGWRDRAAASPFYSENLLSGLVNWSLWIHLLFAVSTFFLWIFVLTQAIRKFPKPPTPREYGGTHMLWARIAAIGMSCTAVSGCTFYWLAFVA